MKLILFVLGWISFALGIVGAFLPILPTTPFLILSAYLFSKSSPRFHAWLLSLPVAGEGIKDWRENRVIKPRAKILCTLMIAVSVFLIWINEKIVIFGKVAVALLLISVWAFVVTRRSHHS